MVGAHGGVKPLTSWAEAKERKRMKTQVPFEGMP
jgi:hypothetical protein